MVATGMAHKPCSTARDAFQRRSHDYSILIELTAPPPTFTIIPGLSPVLGGWVAPAARDNVFLFRVHFTCWFW
jgi:hypothetical protein